MQTYLFYDIESTGLNKAFDQILQFAAIRTDLSFNEIERYELLIKLNPDVIPSPYAMLTHKIPLAEISKGICEYEAIRKIHQWMNTPGTISLGYNTLSFDDEFLRFSFYRNLFSPYTHQFSNQCSRMDIYPITVLYFLYKNSALKWPKINDKISLTLENINNENQFVKGAAHNAMVDVEATLALTKKLSAEKEMWEYTRGYFDKRTDQDRLQKFDDDTALMILGKFGSEKFFQTIGLSLGNHYHYKNQFLWLKLDDNDFSTVETDKIIESSFIIQKKLGEPPFLLPLKERFIQHLDKNRIELANSNKGWLAEHPDLLKKITEHYRSFTYPAYPNVDIDASLYINGFWSQQEEKFCDLFKKADVKEKVFLTETIKNPRLYSFALRILGRNYPTLMTPQLQSDFDKHLQIVRSTDETQIRVDFKNQRRLTAIQALEQIQELEAQHKEDPQKLAILQDLKLNLNLTCDR